MAITSSDILNLSHALKDICEVNCNTPECLSQTLKILLQYNLIQANLQYMLKEKSDCRLPSTTNEQDHDADALQRPINLYAHKRDRQAGQSSS